MDPLIIVVAMVFVVLALIVMFTTLFRKVGPNEALIVYGFGLSEPRVVKGGGTLVLPMVQSARSLRPYLRPDRLVPLGGRFGEIEREVAGSAATPRAKLQAIFDHVVATMQYDYKKESPKLGEGDVAVSS